MISNKLKLELLSAIEQRDAARLGRVVELLRSKYKMNYAACYALARELTGITEPQWDELLYEADHIPG